MIASTLVAAALASTNPAQAAAPAPAAPAKKAHHAGMAGHEHMKSAKGMAEGKMDCCKDGCECCAHKGAAKAGDSAPAH